MELIHQAPTTSSFTPLAVHQSQTPESFYSGPPVLYHHSPSATLSLHASDLAAAPALSALANGARRGANGTAAVAVNGDGAAAEEEEEEDEDEEIEIPGVDVWVTSERFILYSSTLSTGLSIPYPSISLHAVQRPTDGKPASLFLQLLTEAQTFDDHDPDSTISMTIVPAAAAATAPAHVPEEPGRDAPHPESQAQHLYAALSACANLHPDPVSGSEADAEDEDGEGGGGGARPGVVFEGDRGGGGVYPLGGGEEGGEGLPPPMPGSGGWITAENVGEFFDEEGNWRGDRGEGREVDGGGGGGLGEGAGTVRTREEDGDGEDGGGEGGGAEETKWRRTD
ncbi:hypothetical protein IMSHALPRED_000553 [Imshaugia aleurites]|uniref:Regulator of volume decrease after cellular swelling-domain-containing protein n=1 Tax=Imshaugia aleurites TaxID=172621 RepID=A0A8H3GCU3_9LECA|nr:hypothetical protein IMSHALPRED_000553 [Imshaugia aleurites]